MTHDPNWNDRYVAYAKAHGRTPEEMRAHDKATWSCACMLPFMQWNHARIAEWCKERGYRGDSALVGEARHADYDAWLAAYAERARIPAGQPE